MRVPESRASSRLDRIAIAPRFDRREIEHRSTLIIGRELVIERRDMQPSPAPSGRIIAEQCARDNKLVSLEMGGKNAIIIMDDADLDNAVEGSVWGAFGTSGQRCTASSRLVVHKKVYKKFVEKFVERVKKLRVGNCLEFPTIEV